jgi:aspartate ammonia-lyase
MQNLNRFLSDVELFHGLNHHELDVVAKSIVEKPFATGEYLFKKGDSRSCIFIINEGIVSLTGKDVFGKETPLVTFGSTDFLGEGSLLDDDLHSTTASALVDSTVYSLDKKFFQDHGSITLKVFSNIARVISRRMQRVNAKILHSDGQYYSGKTRTEHDLLGYKEVPEADYYGVQTLRAVENFNITGVSISAYQHIIIGLAMVKKAAALANFDLGMIDEPVKEAIVQACDEIISGKYHNHFVVDMIQGGAGTSTNMNANEVIANRALEILGHKKGDYEHCHPNNHVNLSQSTNDAYPTSVKLALILSKDPLLDALRLLIQAFRNKGKEFAHVIKMGRTQLQDAVPMTLGQEFEAWAVTLDEEVKRIEQNARLFLEINMGATAIGTGINADPEYSGLVVNHLREIAGLNFVLASNLVEATQDTGAFIMFSSAIKRLAVKLSKISNDLRLLSSGPRAGFGEINLPPMQPGSSIMPGKVNPVIPEVVNQIAFKVIGNDLTVTLASEAGQLELNVMEPVIVQSLFESIGMLTAGMKTLQIRCIEGITANEAVCRSYVSNSIGIVTALNPVLGYEICSNLAKVALRDNLSVYDLVLENNYMTKEELEEILKPENMLQSQKLSKKK